MTLALLLTAVTGAWATTDVYLVGNGNGNWLNGVAWDPGAAGNKMTEQNGVYSITFTNVAANSELQFKFAINGTWDENYGCTSDTENELNKTLSNIEVFGTNILFRLTETADLTISFNPSEMTYMISTKGMKVGDDASSGPKVAWNAAEKTGTFTMPGSDVVLTPLYAPAAKWDVVENVEQLPAALEGVIADTDAPLIVEGTVAFAGTSAEVKQGTVMYAVTPATVTEAPALDAANKWSADVPTAKLVADGGVDVLVWYYIKGADTPQGQTATAENTFNDSEICATPIKVTVLTNKFDIQFTAANDNTIQAGKATVTVDGQSATVTDGKLQGVKMGSEVKMTAKPGYKFRKVEVKKKEAGKPLANATAEDIGKVVCAAGHLHDAKTAVPDGCTAVGILGKVTETGHGLILSLQDAKLQTWNTINGWTSVTSYASTTLKVLPDDARGTALPSYTALGETTVSNWAVAQKSDYEPIFINLGSTTGNDKGTTYDANVNAYITGIGGREISGLYWSATEEGGNYARYFRSSKWSVENKSESLNVRPVLGF